MSQIQVTRCQFGNRSDTSGYQESAQVEILDSRESLAGMIYLVKQIGTDLVGTATYKKEKLVCTNSRLIGFDGFNTVAQVAYRLGFVNC